MSRRTFIKQWIPNKERSKGGFECRRVSHQRHEKSPVRERDDYRSVHRIREPNEATAVAKGPVYTFRQRDRLTFKRAPAGRDPDEPPARRFRGRAPAGHRVGMFHNSRKSLPIFDDVTDAVDRNVRETIAHIVEPERDVEWVARQRRDRRDYEEEEDDYEYERRPRLLTRKSNRLRKGGDNEARYEDRYSRTRADPGPSHSRDYYDSPRVASSRVSAYSREISAEGERGRKDRERERPHSQRPRHSKRFERRHSREDERVERCREAEESERVSGGRSVDRILDDSIFMAPERQSSSSRERRESTSRRKGTPARHRSRFDLREKKTSERQQKAAAADACEANVEMDPEASKSLARRILSGLRPLQLREGDSSATYYAAVANILREAMKRQERKATSSPEGSHSDQSPSTQFPCFRDPMQSLTDQTQMIYLHPDNGHEDEEEDEVVAMLSESDEGVFATDFFSQGRSNLRDLFERTMQAEQSDAAMMAALANAPTEAVAPSSSEWNRLEELLEGRSGSSEDSSGSSPDNFGLSILGLNSSGIAEGNAQQNPSFDFTLSNNNPQQNPNFDFTLSNNNPQQNSSFDYSLSINHAQQNPGFNYTLSNNTMANDPSNGDCGVDFAKFF